MQFGPVLQRIYHKARARPDPHFRRIRGFIAGANSAIRRQGSRSRRISHGESRCNRRSFAGASWAADEKQGNSHNGLLDRIGPAVGPRADRHRGLACWRHAVRGHASAQHRAQEPAPKPAPRRNRPRTQPAPATQPAQPQQQAGEQPQLMYSPWMKVCGKGQDTNNKQVCVITKDGRLENGMPVAIVQLFEPEGEQKVLRVTVPLGMQLRTARASSSTSSQPMQQPYKICFPVGCMADYPVDRRHDRQDEEGPEHHRAGDQHAGHADQPAAAARRFRQGL